MTALTPMLQQYLEIKEQHKDELLFFRLGDFYELFNEDALTASRELNLTLTKRAGGKAGASSSMPMCGVPFHSVDGYLAKLIRKGYKIAICDQMEDPKKAVGIVKRQVTKILTPGTVLSDAVLEESHTSTWPVWNRIRTPCAFPTPMYPPGMCLVHARGKDREEAVLDQMYRIQPAELVLTEPNEAFGTLLDKMVQKLPDCMINHWDPIPELDYFTRHFGSDSPGAKIPLVRGTVEHMLQYIHENVKSDLAQINRLREITTDAVMNLDATAIRNLELVKNMKDGTRHAPCWMYWTTPAPPWGPAAPPVGGSTLLDTARIRLRQQAIGTWWTMPGSGRTWGMPWGKSPTWNGSCPGSKWFRQRP